MAYYYGYYSFSYFFLFFIFFFLLILILFPNYTKKDIVPPLSDANYGILPGSVGTLSVTDIKSSTFRDLTIQDGSASNTDAIEFNNDQTEVSFIPYYSESHKRLIGFFELNIATAQDRTLGFRVTDDNLNPGNTLEDYNYGWTSLKTSSAQGLTSTPVYRVVLPFNLPGYVNRNHNVRVQIATANGENNGLELSSAYLYYYSV